MCPAIAYFCAVFLIAWLSRSLYALNLLYIMAITFRSFLSKPLGFTFLFLFFYIFSTAQVTIWLEDFSGAPPAQFVTRDDIQRRNPTELSQLLARMGRRASECRNPIIYVDGMVMSPPAQDDPQGLMRALRSDSVQKIGAPAPRGTQLSQIPPAWIEEIGRAHV